MSAVFACCTVPRFCRIGYFNRYCAGISPKWPVIGVSGISGGRFGWGMLQYLRVYITEKHIKHSQTLFHDTICMELKNEITRHSIMPETGKR